MQCELLAEYNVKSLGDVSETVEHNDQVPVQAQCQCQRVVC